MKGRTVALLALFFTSGASALIYEVVWTRMLTLHFGATALSLAAVLTAYMAGLALGSALLARFARRISQPLRVYGLLELGVALIAVAVPFVLDAATPLLTAAYDGAAGPTLLFQALRLTVALAVLLPLTVMMGATLPALTTELTQAREQLGLEAGRAYALNTLGAMAGAFFAGFFLIRWVGMRESWWTAVALNAAIGVLALAIARRRNAPAAEAPAAPAPDISAAPATAVIALCGSAGFASLAYELLWTRYFINSFDSTVAAFTTILIAYLGGLSLGAFGAAWVSRRRAVQFHHLALLQGAVAVLAVLLLGALSDLPQWYFSLIGSLGSMPVARVVLVVAVMSVPTFLMGMVLPLGIHLLRGSSGAVGATVGRVNAASSAGSALGPLGAALVLLPLFGLSKSILVVASLQAVIAAVLAVSVKGAPLSSKRAPVLLAAGTVLLSSAFAWRHQLDGADPARVLPVKVVEAPPGEKPTVLCYRESPHGTTVVTEEPVHHERTLFIDGFAASSNSFGTDYMRMMGHLPMLLNPSANSALVICLGTGTTVGSVSLHQPARLDVAELNPEVVACSGYFEQQNHGVLSKPATHVVIDDGRNYLQMGQHTYDVVTLEPLPPFFAGTVSLYSKEFNQLVRRHLNKGGVFAQWLPFHLVTDRDAKMIVKAVSDVFAHVEVFKMPRDGCAIILASDEPLVFRPEVLAARPEAQRDLASFGYGDVESLERAVVLHEDRVSQYTAGIPPVTDDHPWLEYRAWADEGVMYQDLRAENIRRFRVAAGLSPDE